jgi:membrane protein DedA with SNARE-associated domain
VNPFEAFGVWLSSIIAWVLDLVVAIGPVWSTALAGLGIFLETSLFVGLVVPGDTIVVAAATAVRDPVHFVALLLVVIVGTLAGQSVGFTLGRWWGPALRASRLGRRIGESTWDRAATYVDRRGGLAVFVSRFLPVLHALMPVTVGMSKMPYRKFITWAAPAAAIWAAAYVTAGTFAGAAFRDLLINGLHYAGYVFAGLIVVFFIAAWLIKRRLTRAEDAVIDGGGRMDDDVQDDEPV